MCPRPVSFKFLFSVFYLLLAPLGTSSESLFNLWFRYVYYFLLLIITYNEHQQTFQRFGLSSGDPLCTQ